MSTRAPHGSAALRRLPRLPLAAALPPALAGCEAMGELTRSLSWAWIAGVVIVVAVVGCLTSRMRR